MPTALAGRNGECTRASRRHSRVLTVLVDRLEMVILVMPSALAVVLVYALMHMP